MSLSTKEEYVLHPRSKEHLVPLWVDMGLYTKKYVCRYGRYQGLSYEEAWAIKYCMAENDRVPMAQLLLNPSTTLSAGFRSFIADLLTGKKRPAGNPPLIRRDLNIYEAVIMRQPGLPLRSSRKRLGVYATIGGEYGLSEGAVEQIYKKVKRSAPFSSKRSERIHVEIVLERIPHLAMTITKTHSSADGTTTTTIQHIPAYPADDGDAEIE